MVLSHLAAILSGVLSHAVAASHVLFATAPAVIPGEVDDDDGDGESGEVVPSIADVGKAILDGMSEDEKARQLAAGDDDDEPDAGAVGDKVDDDDDTELEGRAAIDEAAAAAAADKGKPGAKAKDADAPEPIKVILPGLAARGEEDLEIEVDDKDIADRLRRLKNDGVRAKEYGDRRAQLEEREAEIAAVNEAIEADPVAFTLEKMSTERQLEVARALILEHLDVLTPEIDELINDPQKRADGRIKLRDDLKKSTETLATARNVKAYAQKCVRAFEALIPEGTDEDTAAEFSSDARQILGAAAKRGEKVTPETVPAILARRIKLYGFDGQRPKPAASAKVADADRPRAARPLSDKAREIAARKAGTASQAGIRRTQAARNAGSKVAPAGAGAAPVQLPAVPPEAEQDIAAMSKHLRSGKLAETWGQADT